MWIELLTKDTTYAQWKWIQLRKQCTCMVAVEEYVPRKRHVVELKDEAASMTAGGFCRILADPWRRCLMMGSCELE
jgi:hypothetical protein